VTWLGTVEAISPSTEILSATAKRLRVKWIRVAAVLVSAVRIPRTQSEGIGLAQAQPSGLVPHELNL
jgi:hypothetical protein